MANIEVQEQIARTAIMCVRNSPTFTATKPKAKTWCCILHPNTPCALQLHSLRGLLLYSTSPPQGMWR